MSIELKDKLYTSTQVAEILGVSLRTLYRYMEDSRIASMRTASGRHRFTKDQILDFLNGGEGLHELEKETVEPQATSFNKPFNKPEVTTPLEKVASPVVDLSGKTSVDEEVLEKPFTTVAKDDMVGNQLDVSFDKEDLRPLSIKDELPVDEDPLDLESDPIVAENPVRKKIVETFKPFKSPFEEPVVPQPKAPVEKKEPVVEELVDMTPDLNIRYYKSDSADLIRLAKKIHEVAESKDLEYAFSGYAGLSLHFLIKPFTLLHFYANPEDMQIWREELGLSPVSKKEESNIGIVVNTDIVFVPTKEMGGFKVVEDKVLLRDLADHKENELVRQFRLHLANATS